MQNESGAGGHKPCVVGKLPVAWSDFRRTRERPSSRGRGSRAHRRRERVRHRWRIPRGRQKIGVYEGKRAAGSKERANHQRARARRQDQRVRERARQLPLAYIVCSLISKSSVHENAATGNVTGQPESDLKETYIFEEPNNDRFVKVKTSPMISKVCTQFSFRNKSMFPDTQTLIPSTLEPKKHRPIE